MAERQLEQMAPLLKNVQRLGGSGPGSRRRDVFLRSFQVAAQQQESASTQKAEREVSHMVVVMVGSFCLCYTPYAALAMYIVNNRNHGVDLRLVTIPAFFSKSACVYNPIIYCFMNKQVKFSFKKNLFGAVLGLCCCPQAFSSCGEQGASHCGHFSCCGARVLGSGFSSCGTWV